MKENEYDFIIVGQGLAGSVLSYLLLKENKKILVIDLSDINSSSQVAAGLVNPVTGRRVVKSWMAETLIPFARNFYGELEDQFNQKFYYEMDVVEVVHSIKEVNEWSSRLSAEDMHLYNKSDPPEDEYTNYIHEFKKLFRIGSSAWMNIPVFIKEIRLLLESKLFVINEEFDPLKLKIENKFIRYDNLTSGGIIFCEGIKGLQNPLWSWLPLVPAKGEIFTVLCEAFPQDYIILSGIFMIPLGNHLFRIGSTYEWNYQNELPSEEGKKTLISKIDALLKVPYSIIDHRAGIRPTVKDRRPIIGKHPEYENVFVFNGMGTKGVQLAPYFGNHFMNYLIEGEKLMNEVNVNRFKK